MIIPAARETILIVVTAVEWIVVCKQNDLQKNTAIRMPRRNYSINNFPRKFKYGPKISNEQNSKENSEDIPPLEEEFDFVIQ